MVWRALYPIGIHFLISQAVAYAGRYFLVDRAGLERTAYNQYAMMLTGITGLFALIPAMYFYKKDSAARAAGGIVPEKKAKPLSVLEYGMFLIMGAFLGIYGNLIVSPLKQLTDSSAVYQEAMNAIMDGKSMLVMIFWIGILAPLAEEAIFRWLIYLRLRDHMQIAGAAVLSGLLFGIFHMNLIQGVYALILGAAFAMLMEWRGRIASSALLHMGANIASLLLGEYLPVVIEKGAYGIFMAIFMSGTLLAFAGIVICRRDYEKRGRKRSV
ncbi:lysostaphin resistance A-like protein [Ruminococcus sp. 5_1_39BFAA]|uniref:CPBP family intramembrane glutamic endopeptidase n=1 Tax=Ruminococcus sp. 5_1_39BFAA TaxID=457412 RepID=UPI00356707F5